MKSAVASAKDHWKEKTPAFGVLARSEASELIELGIVDDLKPSQLLAAVGLAIPPSAWRNCSEEERQVLYQAIKCRLWISAAISDFFVERDERQRGRILAFVKKQVAAAREYDASKNSYDFQSFKKLRVLEAALAALAFLPLVRDAKRKICCLRRSASATPILEEAALALTMALMHSPLQSRTEVEPADLGNLRRARPEVVALAIASRAFRVKPAEVRRLLEADEPAQQEGPAPAPT
jgi:hypothetical protein